MPSLMDRAIGEINDLQPRPRHLHRRPDDVRVQAGVRPGEVVPRPARVRVARRRARKPRLAERRVRPLRAALRRRATRCCTSTACRSSRSTRPSRTSTTARSAAAATSWIEEQFARRTPTSRSSCCTTICCRFRAPAASATSSTTRATRSSACSAQASTSCSPGHKHVPYAWRLEDLFIVNTGTVSSLRLRGNTRPCYNVVEINGLARRRLAQVPVPRAGADHPVLDRDARPSRSTRRASSRR